MYMGGTPIQQMVQEVVDNSSDEFNETNQGSKKWNILIRHEVTKPKVIEASKGKKGGDRTLNELPVHTFIIADRGRGIPIEINKDIGMSTLTGALTQLQGGGKFDAESYEAGKGTNGTGVCATNALSKQLEAWTFRSGIWYYQQFQFGKPTTAVIKKDPPKEFAKNKCGTIIKFTVDNSIEQVACDVFELSVLKNWLNIVSMIDAPIKIQLEYTVKGVIKAVEFFKPEGAVEYLRMKLAEHKLETFGKRPFSFSSKFGTVVCQWASTEETLFEGFTNGVYNKLGGTHMDGFYSAIVKAFNGVMNNKKKELKEADLRAGLVGMINVRLPEAQYAGQVKDELKSPIKKNVEATLIPELTIWFEKNKSMVKEIFERAFALREAKLKAKELMKAATKVKGSTTKGALLPGILVTCDPRTPIEERELFIVEGDSASGPAKQARDRFFQEVMCLTGKPLNALRHPLAKVLKSKPVLNILVSVGVDPKEFRKGIPKDPQFRVGRIILLPDGDNDGAHIANLALSVFYKLLPSVFELGMVYVVDSPLYSASSKKGEKVYAYTLKEIQKKAKAGWTITRMKGWGEAPVDDLADIAFDLKTRKLFQIKPVSGTEGTEFVKVVGDDPTMRKRILGITGGTDKPTKVKKEKISISTTKGDSDVHDEKRQVRSKTKKSKKVNIPGTKRKSKV
jgi:DNA gyrase subunit B